MSAYSGYGAPLTLTAL